MSFSDPHSFAEIPQGTIRHIDFAFEADFGARRLRGRAVYKIDRAVHDAFCLDTRNLKIQGVEGPDGPVGFELDAEDKVRGQRLRLTGLGGADTFTITFSTAPLASALQWLDPSQTAGGEHPYLFSQCQAIHARSVFPCQDTPSVRFTYRATIKAPAPLKAVMSADRTEVREEAGAVVCSFDMPQPIPSYLFALAVGDIAEQDLGPRSRIYAEPAVLAQAAHEFAETEQMISEAESLFGPYVWDRFDMLVMPPSFPYGGMENPRLTFLTPTLITGDRSMVNVVVHELAHSWTGNLVTNATWEDFWLNEGWTVYAERRILELMHGRDYAQMKAVLRHKSMMADMQLFGMEAEPTKLKFSQEGIDPDEVFSTIPYEKGAALITMLAEAVGREAFDPFIKKYIDTFQFQSLTTEGFLEFLQAELPEAAEQVDVSTWIYSPGYPSKAPVYASGLLDTVDAALAAQAGGTLPTATEVADWRPEQVELFLKGLPRELPVAACRDLEATFGLASSHNRNQLTEFYVISIKSGYEDVLAGVEELVSTVGRMLYLKPIYRALATTEWSAPQTRALFEKHRATYHPIAAGGLERILADAGL